MRPNTSSGLITYRIGKTLILLKSFWPRALMLFSQDLPSPFVAVGLPRSLLPKKHDNVVSSAGLVGFIIAYSNSCFSRFGKALSVRHRQFDEIEFSCSIYAIFVLLMLVCTDFTLPPHYPSLVKKDWRSWLLITTLMGKANLGWEARVEYSYKANRDSWFPEIPP